MTDKDPTPKAPTEPLPPDVEAELQAAFASDDGGTEWAEALPEAGLDLADDTELIVIPGGSTTD